MASIPQPRARDFQLERAPQVRGVDPIRTSGLEHLGRTMTARGLELAADQARQEGIEAQTASDGTTLVKRDSSFFGFFDADFDEGAKFVFQKQKQQQIDGIVGEVEAANPRDPKAFRQALEERREEVFDGLPSDVRAGVKLYFDQESGAASRRLETAGVAHERRVQKSQMMLEVERFGRSAALEVENTGEVTPETEGTLEAIRSRMAEMGFLPEEIDAAERKVRDDLSVASLVHQYRNLPSDQRAAWARSLLSNDGPLKDRDFVERSQIVAKIRSIDDLDKAEARARRSIIIKQANDALAVEKAGHKHQATPRILAGLATLAGGGDADAALKLDELNGAVRVRETLETSRISAEGDIRLAIGTLRQKNAGPGLTSAESSLLEGLEDGLAARRKAIAEGKHLDYALNNAAGLARVGFEGKSRADQVALLEELWGGRASYLTETEAAGLQRQWDQGSVEDQAAVMAQVSEVPPEHRGGVLRQLARKDQGMAVVASLIDGQNHPDPASRRSLAEEVMQGRAFRKEQPGLLQDAKDVERDLTSLFGEVFGTRGATSLVTSYTDAALSVYAHRRRLAADFKKAGTTELKAIRDELLGGEAWSTNGQRLAPLRPGFKRSQSRDLWRRVTDDALRSMASQGPLPEGLSGLPVDNTVAGQQHEVSAERIVDEGWPRPAGDGSGRFVIVMPDNRVTGEPFVLKDPRTGRNFLFDPSLVGTQVPPADVDFGGGA